MTEQTQQVDKNIIKASRGRCPIELITDMKTCHGYLPRHDNPQPESCVWLDKYGFRTCLRSG